MSARRHLKKQPVDGVSIADRSCVFLSLGGRVLTMGPASSADTSANKIVYDAECTDGKAWSISPIDNNVGLKMYGGGLGTLPRALSDGWTIEVRCFLTAAPISSHIFGYHELYPAYFGSAGGSRVGLLAYGGANNRNIYFWGEGADLDSGVEWDVSGGATHVIVTHAPGTSSVTIYIRKGLTTSVVSGSLSGSLTNFTPEGIFTGSRQGSGSNPVTGKISKQAIYAGCKTREQALALLNNPWLTIKGRRRLAKASTGGSSADLTISDATHGHSADNLTLSTEVSLTIADALHGHSADSLILSSGSFLSVADALHGHASDNLTLSNDLSLTVADALHGHSADNLGLSTDVWLVVADASHGHTADSLALFSDSFLVVADATHGHTADAVAMDVATTLSISKATHAHTADALALSVVIVLVVDDATHALTSDAVAIAANSILSVAKAVHAHTADVVSITISGTPTLTADDIAAIADAVWNHPKALTLARFIALK